MGDESKMRDCLRAAKRLLASEYQGDVSTREVIPVACALYLK